MCAPIKSIPVVCHLMGIDLNPMVFESLYHEWQTLVWIDLSTAFKTFCSIKRGTLTGTSWDFWDIASEISAPWEHGSTSLDVNKANGMLTSNTKGILFLCGRCKVFYVFLEGDIRNTSGTIYTLGWKMSLFFLVWRLHADRRNKTLECWLTTLNASSAIMSHALEQTKAARIGVICKSIYSLFSNTLSAFNLFSNTLSRVYTPCIYRLSVSRRLPSL